ncbi:nucleoside triphosphate pyrophosphohydrolase family protein [Paenibacillus sp. FSL L8-0708]|uniref:nucleoside triphosphate pyrophosphohydrolase family protein n=1 Tax=Paenibacillus sp. FSL L8-0708 TaxID=2975311 RepID=UPI004046D1D6
MGEITFTEYQAAAERTANSQTVSTDEQRFANFGMGLSGEAGEVTDLLKKVVFHGHTLDAAELETELGDVLWYVAALANTAGLSLAGIAEKNVAKLRTRYPEGFDVIRSIKREVGAK